MGSLRSAAVVILLATVASAQTETAPLAADLRERDCYDYIRPEAQLTRVIAPNLQRLLREASRHRLAGTASYYSTFFNGRKTANGERFHNSRFSAAHRTLPLGSWVEVRSLATGKQIRLRVNDRGPFKGGFVIDLSQAAARKIGVDRAADRRVKITLLALPGEDPLPELQEPSAGDDEAERTPLIRD